jgi:hypothetical protein
VDAAIDATQASLSAFVGQFVEQQLSQARQQLESYSDRWGTVQAQRATWDVLVLEDTHRKVRLNYYVVIQALLMRFPPCSYLTAMGASLDAHARGAEHRLQALNQVSSMTTLV